MFLWPLDAVALRSTARTLRTSPWNYRLICTIWLDFRVGSPPVSSCRVCHPFGRMNIAITLSESEAKRFHLFLRDVAHLKRCPQVAASVSNPYAIASTRGITPSLHH